MSHDARGRSGSRRRLKSLALLRRRLACARRAEPLEFEQLVVRFLIGVFTTSCALIS